jgi:flagellar biosynthesis chaperone FliJ
MSSATSYEDLQERLDDLYEELLQADAKVKDLMKYRTELRHTIQNLERQAGMALDRELGGRGY